LRRQAVNLGFFQGQLEAFKIFSTGWMTFDLCFKKITLAAIDQMKCGDTRAGPGNKSGYIMNPNH
jgi:hypothetical protein